ncbi:hypothetical protein PV04_09175 [Phialophora macrospora]|uniref:Zn(2)-C6 fungal-type domain-containing protein n=1 Tax=Phialophora macrospora TaxID=1851006 RepID=A0A0D2FW57_9EURO|nr:hypothetical protein PV04_09175 [Phialophora macrospora]
MSVQNRPTDLTLQAVRETLRKKRKGQKLRPCYPCRQRKVKCDDSRPCKRCIERGHDNLCFYEPPRSSEPRSNPDSSLDVQSLLPSPEHTHSGSQVAHSVPAATAATHDKEFEVYLGEQSVPSFVQEHVENGAQSADPRTAELGRDVLPMLGLRPPAPGLLDWQVEGQPTQGYHDTLPGRDEILARFSDYRHTVYPLSPHLMSIDNFERQLCSFLQRKPPQSYPRDPEPGLATDLGWRSLLLAVLASGTQFSAKSVIERRSTCNQYLSGSLWCLNASLGFIRPSLQSIQTLIIIVNVLQNQLLTEAAWTLVGLLSRQAQALGLHRTCDSSSHTGTEQLDKIRLWWTIVWQDSLLSVGFDRPPVTSIKSVTPLSILDSSNKRFTYEEAMYALSHLLLRGFARNHTLDQQAPTQEDISSAVHQAEDIISRLYENIRSLSKCDTLEHHVQHYCFKLHSSFTIGTLLRPSLSRHRWDNLAADRKEQFASQCIASYVSSLEAFLDIDTVSIAASRSWALLHNGLTSALVLAITGQTRRRPAVAELHSRLIETLTRYSSEHEQGGLFWGPHSRAISALKKIDLRRIPETTEPHGGTGHPEMAGLNQCQPIDSQGHQDVGYPPLTTDPASEISSEQQGLERYAFDPETINHISAFLPNAEPGDDLMLDDIFDSVFWGDYGQENNPLN